MPLERSAYYLRGVVGDSCINILFIEQVRMLFGSKWFERLGTARRQYVDHRIVQACVIEHPVIIPLDDNALLGTVPDDVVVHEQVPGQVVAANAVAAPVEGVVIVDPVIAYYSIIEIDAVALYQSTVTLQQAPIVDMVVFYDGRSLAANGEALAGAHVENRAVAHGGFSAAG